MNIDNLELANDESQEGNKQEKAAEARPFNLIERVQSWMFGNCDFDERDQYD